MKLSWVRRITKRSSDSLAAVSHAWVDEDGREGVSQIPLPLPFVPEDNTVV